VSSTTSDTTIAGLSTTTKKGISAEEHDDGESNLSSQCQDMAGKEFQCRYYAVVFDFCEKYSFINGMVFTGKFLKCLLRNQTHYRPNLPLNVTYRPLEKDAVIKSSVLIGLIWRLKH